MKAITHSQAGAALGRVSSPAKSAAARANGALGGRPAKGSPQWAGEYSGMEFWGFSSLRGYWNATRRVAVKSLPSHRRAFEVPDLTAEESAAIEAAATAAGK
jgi:hypothetical protein